MLKRISPILSPELIHLLAQMGHGDEIVIADANFPAASVAQRLVRAEGHPIPALLDAVLQFFPLDSYVNAPVVLMDVVPGDPPEPDIWETYAEIIACHERAISTEHIERFAFYERARKA